MKTGRNDPCPCGSGKKYKKCCLVKAEAEDFPYRRISRVYDSLVERMMAFVDKEIERDLMDEALDEFMLRKGKQGPLVPFEGFSQLFVPWALFTWRLPESTAQAIAQGAELPPAPTVADIYFAKKGRKLEPYERKVLHTCIGAPLTFCEVTDAAPGRGFDCVDLFTQQAKSVFERSASEVLAKGDVYFCSIATVDEFDILLATSPVKFPPSARERVQVLREGILTDANDAAALREHDAEVRALFLELHKEVAGAPQSAPSQQGGLEFNEKAMQDPEVRARLQEVFCQQWRKWVDTPLSALKGETPRQAVKKSEGREKVAALLKQAASTQSAQLELQLAGIEEARKALGL